MGQRIQSLALRDLQPCKFIGDEEQQQKYATTGMILWTVAYADLQQQLIAAVQIFDRCYIAGMLGFIDGDVISGGPSVREMLTTLS